MRLDFVHQMQARCRRYPFYAGRLPALPSWSAGSVPLVFGGIDRGRAVFDKRFEEASVLVFGVVALEVDVVSVHGAFFGELDGHGGDRALRRLYVELDGEGKHFEAGQVERVLGGGFEDGPG